MGIVCGKTETEMQAAYGPFYDKANAPRFCWKITATNGAISYVENLSEKMANYWYGPGAGSIEKVTCGYCQKWLTRQKQVAKPSGLFNYAPIKAETYCGDTCSTLYNGRLIILRETADSIIYHEFMQKL